MADTFTAVSMRPREQTSLRSLKPTATADIISFYNLVRAAGSVEEWERRVGEESGRGEWGRRAGEESGMVRPA